jgi:hypothetical protein
MARVEAYSRRRPASGAQLAAAAGLEAACFPQRGGGAAAAAAELARAMALQRAALLLCTRARGGDAARDGSSVCDDASPHAYASAAADSASLPLLGYALVTWTAGAGSVAKARACAAFVRSCAR